MMHLFLDRWELVLVDCMPAHVEDFVIGAHRIVAATVVSLVDLLCGEVLLRQRDVFIFLIHLLLILLGLGHHLVVIRRLPSGYQLLRR